MQWVTAQVGRTRQTKSHRQAVARFRSSGHILGRSDLGRGGVGRFGGPPPAFMQAPPFAAEPRGPLVARREGPAKAERGRARMPRPRFRPDHRKDEGGSTDDGQ
jgi:hypothetical protein